MRRPTAAELLFLSTTLLTGGMMVGQSAPSLVTSTQVINPENYGNASDANIIAASASAADVDEYEDLVGQIGARYTTHHTDHFMLVHAAGRGWADYTGQLLEKTYANFYSTFRNAGFTPRPANQRLVWVCFSQRDQFDDYALKADRMDMSWSKGYYSTRTNRVALLQRSTPGTTTAKSGSDAATSGAGVYQVFETTSKTNRDPFVDVANATHEAAHQLAFNSGIQKRGVMYPLWASEGMAANFEAEDAGHFELGGENASRKRDLIEAYREGRLYSLPEFVTLNRLPFGNQQLIHDIYAEAWGFFRFLITERHSDLQKYLAALAKLEPGRRDNSTMRAEFVLAFGSVSGLEKDWQKYLAHLADGN
jgi:hypothetical protein